MKPNNGQKKNSQGKNKSPSVFVEIFPVPVCSAEDKHKITAVIKKLPENLGREHNEPDKKILDFLKKLTDFQRAFFFQEATKMPEEKLLEALKKIATAKEKETETTAKKAGLLPQPEQKLPTAAGLKPLLVIKQLCAQARPDQRESFQKLEQWWEKAPDSVKKALIFKLAPLKSAEAVGIIKSLTFLNEEQKNNYFEGDENA